MSVIRKQSAAHMSTYQFAIHCVEPLDSSCVELDGVRDVTENLLKSVCGLLVQENSDGFARLHTASDDGHQLGPDKVFVLLGVQGAGFGTGQ